MPFNPLKEISLHIFTWMFWLILSLLYVLTFSVYAIEYKASNGEHALMWLLSAALWVFLAHTYFEYLFYIINQLAGGEKKFPLLEMSVLSVQSGPKRFIKVFLSASIAIGVLNLFASGFFSILKSSFLILFIILGPAFIIAISLSRKSLFINGIVKIPGIIRSFGLDYIYCSSILFLVLFVAYFWASEIERSLPLSALLIIYCVNIYVVYLGGLARKYGIELGLNSGNQGKPALNEHQKRIKAAELEFSKIAESIHGLSLENKLKQGKPRCLLFVERAAEQDVDVLIAWDIVWQRVKDWHDRDFLCELMKPYITLLVEAKCLGQMNEIVKPMLVNDRFYPFESLEVCLGYCELAEAAGQYESVVNALEFSTKVFDGELVKQCRLRLLRVVLFKLQDENRAGIELRSLIKEYPELETDIEVQNMLGLLT